MYLNLTLNRGQIPEHHEILQRSYLFDQRTLLFLSSVRALFL